ncbi:MAG: alpha/beta hydrolase [Thermotogaceae bacterium]|nr:alpha/beta hydrolase [Thermotogaceae bacterium]
MRKLPLFLFLLFAIISFSYEVVYYKARLFGADVIAGAFYRTIEKPVRLPELENVKRVVEEIETPPSTLMIVKDGKGDPIILVHGLDIYETQKESRYKKIFIDTVLTAMKNLDLVNPVYMYNYPSTFESMWISGRRLATFTKELEIKNAIIIAHSKGGLVTRAALFFGDFKKRVKKIYFLGTPHLGSIYADAFLINPDDFEHYFKVDEREAELLKRTLVLSYTAGFINSPGSKELAWMNPLLPPFVNYPDVQFVFIAGMIENMSVKDIEQYISVNIKEPILALPGFGLFYLGLISSLITNSKPFIAAVDGLVPVKSALALGKLDGKKYLLAGYNHAGLFSNVKLMEDILKGKY